MEKACIGTSFAGICCAMLRSVHEVRVRFPNVKKKNYATTKD